jgi:hypothetical protein
MADQQQLFEDYKSYYAYMAKKFAGILFERTRQVYEKISELAQQSTDLDTFNEKFKENNFAVELGKAEIIDQCAIRKKTYEGMDESVRADGQQQILDAVEKCESVTELAQAAIDVLRRTACLASVDTAYKGFHAEILQLEFIKMLETAEIPEKYREEFDQEAAKLKADIKKSWENIFIPKFKQIGGQDWEYDYARLLDPRNRKVYPIKDETLKNYIAYGKSIKGLE